VRLRGWPLALVASALAVAVVAWLPVPEAARFPVVLWFVLVCPGMTVVGLLKIQDLVTRWTLALATSLTLVVLLGSASIYLGLWSPAGILGILIVLTLAGAVVQAATPAGTMRWLQSHLPRWLGGQRPAVDPVSSLSGYPPQAARAQTGADSRPRWFPTDLSDHEWEAIAPLLPPRQAHHKYDPRELCNAILYAERVDVPWEALPNDFPPGQTVARYYRHLRRAGIWQQINTKLGIDDLPDPRREEFASQHRDGSLAHGTRDKQMWPRGSGRRSRVRRRHV
jgi:transposase